MKKVLASVVAVGCLAAAGTAFAGLAAGTGVNGSLHDMTKVVGANADAMGRVCVFCHTPHHAVSTNDTGVEKYPLWNHDLVNNKTYTAYTWATPANDVDDLALVGENILAGPSRLCMSCHDGAIAIDQHGEAMANNPAPANATYIADRAKLTNDLSTTHPIGFDYNKAAEIRNAKAGRGSATAGNATEIVPSDYGFAKSLGTLSNSYAVGEQGVYNEVIRNTVAADGTKNFKLIKDVLYNGNIMTCATCHEVHNKENAVQDAYTNDASKAPNYFLYAKENQSLICLSCHVK